jgi:hypothetical protein
MLNRVYFVYDWALFSFKWFKFLSNVAQLLF